jgi:cytochrome b
VLTLIAVATVILNAKTLGVSSDGKVLLKTVHVYAGYIFVINLLWRFIWAFFGNRFARWKSILPLGADYFRELHAYIRGVRDGKVPAYLGHNPLGRAMVALLFLLLSSQSVTGLVLAGTDLYMPPFGHKIAEWVTKADGDPSKLEGLKPGSKEAPVVAEAYEEMREFRKPYITVHYYVFFVLVAAVVLHIAGVVFAETRERNNIISAMFSGRKVFYDKPVDMDTG